MLLIHGPDGTLELGPEQQARYRQVGQAIGARFSEARDYRSRLLAGQPAPFRCRAGSRSKRQPSRLKAISQAYLSFHKNGASMPHQMPA